MWFHYRADPSEYLGMTVAAVCLALFSEQVLRRIYFPRDTTDEMLLSADSSTTSIGRHLRTYYVYILSNQSRTLYVGVTNGLERRLRQHKAKQIPGFTAKYNVTWLIYYERFDDVNVAIAREKQIKGWTRAKKIALAETMNSRWEDLSAGWGIPV